MPDTLRIGIAGLGTVGAGVLQLLRRNRGIISARAGRPVEVTAVSSRRREADRGVDLSSCRWHDDARLLARDGGVDLVVETIGGESGIARALCEAALAAGKHLVTANKALIAAQGVELAKRAESTGKALMFEAAVAGGIPALKTLREGLAANRVARVGGVLNGTSNFILTRMEREGAGFGESLAEAQRLGYAEADPAFDIDGTDVAQKLSILAAIAFGCATDFPRMRVEGIESVTAEDIRFARELGCAIRLLGIAEMTAAGQARLSVRPCLIPTSSPLNVEGVLNAVAVEGDAAGCVVLQGAGAGAGPTASSVVADIVDIARGCYSYPFSVPANDLRTLPEAAPEDLEGRYFLRCAVTEAHDAAARIAAALDERGIAVASCIERPGTEKSAARQAAFTTGLTLERLVEDACAAAGALECAVRPPVFIRMENI